MNLQHLEIIDSIRSLMVYHSALGMKEYPREPGIVQFLDRKKSGSAGVERVLQQRKVVPVVTETLQDIAAEINSCKNCELHDRRVAPVPGRGGEKARLLIVGGWLTVTEQAGPGPGLVFGPEEDTMLSRMLEAIHLPQHDVFVTNLLKCVLPGSCQPVAADLHCCFTYLRRQIAVISPDVICSMGIIATRALLDLPQSLSQLRGRFHLYTTLGGTQIPLMPTYHPTYLLQVPEMKSETWKDLQLIEKKLAG